MENDLLYRAYKVLEHVYDCDDIGDDHILEDDHLELITEIENHLSIKYNINWKEL